MIQDLNYRKTKLIGTNQYADLQEQIKDTKIAQKAVIRLFKKESIGQFMAAAENNTSLIQFFTIKSTKAQEVAFRLSEPFEKLRMAAKHITRQTGNPPTVHLLGFGELKEYKPITDFVTDFFACGGIHCQVLNEDISIDEAIMTLQLIQAQMICLCGSHCQIEKNLDEIKALIKSNSNKRFYVAGVQNNELLDKLKAAGILGHIHQQLNHYLFLEHFFTLLGGQTDATEF